MNPRKTGWKFRAADKRDWDASRMPRLGAAGLPDLLQPDHRFARAPQGFQEYTSSCFGFALSRCIYTSLILRGASSPLVSPLWLYAIARLWESRGLAPALHRLSDVGCYPDFGMAAMRAEGFVAENDWPFLVDKINWTPPPAIAAKAFGARGLQYYRVWEHGLDRLDVVRAAMRKRGSVVFGQCVSDSFKTWNGSGRIDSVSLTESDGHGLHLLAVEDDGTICFDNWWRAWGCEDGTGREAPELFCDPVVTPDVFVIVADADAESP